MRNGEAFAIFCTGCGSRSVARIRMSAQPFLAGAVIALRIRLVGIICFSPLTRYPLLKAADTV